MNFIEKRMGQRGQGGFTLIELLVTIAILAILAGVVVFAVGNSTKNAKKSACLTERGAIITAIAAANASNEVNDASNQEDYADYLKSTDFKYFGTPDQTAGTAARINTGTNGVTTADCAAV